MSNTALGAEKAKEIIFISDAHGKFYYKKLKEVRYVKKVKKMGKSDADKLNFWTKDDYDYQRTVFAGLEIMR